MTAQNVTLRQLFVALCVASIVAQGPVAKADLGDVGPLLNEAKSLSMSGNFKLAKDRYESAWIEAHKAAVYSPAEPGTGGNLLGGLAALREIASSRVDFGDYTEQANGIRRFARQAVGDLEVQLKNGTPYVFGPISGGAAFWRTARGTVYTLTQSGTGITGSARDNNWNYSITGDIVSFRGEIVTARVKCKGTAIDPRAPEQHRELDATFTIDLRASNTIKVGNGPALSRIWD